MDGALWRTRVAIRRGNLVGRKRSITVHAARRNPTSYTGYIFRSLKYLVVSENKNAKL
jgi:hypothetical protein